MNEKSTDTGIEPATYRFVAQHLNHCATAVPPDCTCNTQNSLLLNQHNGDDAPQDPRKYPRYSFLLEAESTPGSKCDRKKFMSMKNSNGVNYTGVLYICIPTNCTQLIYFINNKLKHMYCLKL